MSHQTYNAPFNALPSTNGGQLMQQLATLTHQANVQQDQGRMQTYRPRRSVLALADGPLHDSPPVTKPSPGETSGGAASSEGLGSVPPHVDDRKEGGHTPAKPHNSDQRSIVSILSDLKTAKNLKRDHESDSDCEAEVSKPTATKAAKKTADVPLAVAATAVAAAKGKATSKAAPKAKATPKATATPAKKHDKGKPDTAALKAVWGFVKGYKGAPPNCPVAETTITWNGIRIYVKPAKKEVRCVPFGIRYDRKWSWKVGPNAKSVWPDVIKWCRTPSYPSHFDN
jgi:hypothetical protein